MKEKYLLDIKNAMFWHFSSSEIKDTLEELHTHFESAYHNGLSEEEIINDYGKPKMVAKELMNEVDPIERKRRRLVITKGILFIVCVFGMFVAFSLFPLNTALNIFVIFSTFLIWFLSGINCVVGILPKTKEKYHDFIKSQIVVFLFVAFLHLYSVVIMPYTISKGYNSFLVQNINLYIYFIIVALLFITVLFFRKMLQGNLYMFFVIVQNISVISGLFMYISFLKNIETVENIQFTFTTYFICLPVLFIYWLYIYKNERGNKIGCTD